MKKTIPLPPVDYLHRRLMLSPDGLLVWRKRPASDFSAACYALTWNKKHAGKKAGGDKGRGYEMVRIDGTAYQSHRIAYAIAHGVDLGDLHVDHQDGKRNANHASNLRTATNTENIRHRTKLGVNNTSGVLGVYWSKAARKWCADIKVDGWDLHLGLFERIADAAAARRRAEIEHFGAFAPSIKGARQ